MEIRVPIDLLVRLNFVVQHNIASQDIGVAQRFEVLNCKGRTCGNLPFVGPTSRSSWGCSRRLFGGLSSGLL